MLEVQHLHKEYAGRVAVHDLSFTLPRGQRFGLVGPNGAGKTTTISIIVGALGADSGTVLLEGKPLQSETDPLKSRIGYVPQELALYDDLTAADNLRLFGALYGLAGATLEKRVGAELEAAGLTERAGSRVQTFSGGMKRRLNIAAALLHEPEILILDEPTVGVDPQSRNAIFERIERLGAEGMTLLYTSHYMEEVERLCERIAIMDGGRIVAEGTQTELRALLPIRATRLRVDIAPLSQSCLTEPVLVQLRGLEGVTDLTVQDSQLIFSLADLPRVAPAIQETLTGNGIIYTGLATERPDLEEVFLHVTGRSLRDE